MRFQRYVLHACLLASLLSTPLALAQESELILDGSGQLRKALVGVYGDLFSDGAVTAATPVLAVETVAATGEIGRILIPGTDDTRVESAPILIRDPGQDAFVVLWRTETVDDARLDFTVFDGSEWSEVLTLGQDGVPASVGPELKVMPTRDSFHLELEDGTSIGVDRLIVHLLWRNAQQSPSTHYAPLTLVEGRYIGWHGVFVLDDLLLEAPVDEGGGAAPVPLTAALEQVHEMRAASDDRSVQAIFANSASDRIGSIEISPLPLEIGMLSEQIRDHLLSLADLYDPDDIGMFADAIRATIVIIGQRYDLHDAHTDYVSDQVADWVLNAGGAYGWGGFESLADDAQALTIDVTQEVYVSTSVDPADPDSEIVRMDVSRMFGDPQQSSPMQILDFQERSNLPAPDIGERPVTVFSSRRGGDLLIAWEDQANGQIQWVESLEDGTWSEVFHLTLGDHLTLEAAHQLLARRIH